MNASLRYVAFSTATNIVPSKDEIHNLRASGPREEQTIVVVKSDHLTDDLSQEKPPGKLAEIDPKGLANTFSVMNTPTILAPSPSNTMTSESSNEASPYNPPGPESSALLPEAHVIQASDIHRWQGNAHNNVEHIHTPACTTEKENSIEK